MSQDKDNRSELCRLTDQQSTQLASSGYKSYYNTSLIAQKCIDKIAQQPIPKIKSSPRKQSIIVKQRSKKAFETAALKCGLRGSREYTIMKDYFPDIRSPQKLNPMTFFDGVTPRLPKKVVKSKKKLVTRCSLQNQADSLLGFESKFASVDSVVRKSEPSLKKARLKSAQQILQLRKVTNQSAAQQPRTYYGNLYKSHEGWLGANKSVSAISKHSLRTVSPEILRHLPSKCTSVVEPVRDGKKLTQFKKFLLKNLHTEKVQKRMTDALRYNLDENQNQLLSIVGLKRPILRASLQSKPSASLARETLVEDLGRDSLLDRRIASNESTQN